MTNSLVYFLVRAALTQALLAFHPMIRSHGSLPGTLYYTHLARTSLSRVLPNRSRICNSWKSYPSGSDTLSRSLARLPMAKLQQLEHPLSPNWVTNSSLKLLRFSKTLTDSSMDPVLSVVRAQYYLPHLSILSSAILPNPPSHFLKLVHPSLTKPHY